MYEYLPIEQAKVGNVLEAVYSDDDITKGKLYIIHEGAENDSIGHFIEDDGEPSSGIYLSSEFWKLVKTKPGKEAKVGDTVISITALSTSHSPRYLGSIHTVVSYKYWLGYAKGFSTDSSNFLVLCKPEDARPEENSPKVGDKVIALKDTCTKNPKGDIQTITRIDGKSIHVSNTNDRGWTLGISWDLYEETDEKAKPRVAIVTKHVGGHPIGSRIIETVSNSYWTLESNPNGKTYNHTLGYSCEWEDEMPEEAEAEPPFKATIEVGDTVRYIGPRTNGKPDHDRPEKCVVIELWDDQLHYKSSHTCKIEYWELVSKAQPHKADAAAVKEASEWVQPDETTLPDAITDIANCKSAVDYILYGTPEQEVPFNMAYNQTLKDNNMNENITIAMTAKEFKEYKKENKPDIPKSDLQLAKTLTEWFNPDGIKVGSTTTQTAKQAAKELQKPHRLGHTFRTYTLSASETTAIPTKSLV